MKRRFKVILSGIKKVVAILLLHQLYLDVQSKWILLRIP